MSSDTYLEITYRHGKPLAGYLRLPRREGDSAARSQKHAAGLVVDYAEDGRPIGIEITSPANASIEAINDLLSQLHINSIAEQELAPLLAS
jgi:hypothetical protein